MLSNSNAPDSEIAGFEVLDVEPGSFLFASYYNVTFFVWEAPVCAEFVHRIESSTREIHARSTTGISNVHMSRRALALPTPDGREALTKIMKERADRRACLAIVMGAGGFWASAIRSFITGLRILASRDVALGIYGSVGEAARWLAPAHAERTGVKLDAGTLARAMDRACDLCEQASRNAGKLP